MDERLHGTARGSEGMFHVSRAEGRASLDSGCSMRPAAPMAAERHRLRNSSWRSDAALMTRGALLLPRDAQIRTSVSKIISTFANAAAHEAGLIESAWKPHASKIGDGVAHIFAVFTEAKQRLILGFRCAAAWPRRLPDLAVFDARLDVRVRRID
jgi:hypothetical protein